MTKMGGAAVAVAVLAAVVQGKALTEDEVKVGHAWMPDWPDTDTYAVPLWCTKDDKGGVHPVPDHMAPLLAKAGVATNEKPLFPRFKYMSQYSCPECFRMVETAMSYCKRITPTTIVEDNFVSACETGVHDVASDTTMLTAKCQDFHDYLADLFCPMDPCDHIASSNTNARRAICDSARCYDIKPQATYKHPLTCPVYVDHIMGLCKKMKKEAGPHSRPNLSRAAACKMYAPRFERNGCQVVYDRLKIVADPMSVCSLASCDGLLGGSAEFCEKELNLTRDGPVPCEGYPPSEGSCDDLGGMVILKASYGINCTHENHTNNILSSVRESCQGRANCTFGNRNMRNKTSEWDPLLGDNTCIRAFEIQYRCHSAGPLHILHAPESAKFEARPIDCARELAKARHENPPRSSSPSQGRHIP